MKHCFYIHLFLLGLLTFSNLGGYSQQISPKKEEKIKAILAHQADAWNKGDIEGFMNGYYKSDSLVFIGKSGPTFGWENTLVNYKKGYPDKAAMGKLTFRIIQVKSMGKNYAWVLGAWHLQRESDEPSGYFTLVWKKIKGQWVIISDHSS